MERRELLESVRDLTAPIASRAAEGERCRRLPDATLEELRATGVFRSLVPSRYGGFGFDFSIVPEIGRILGAADVSTGWVTTFLVMHNWLLAQFPDAVCREVFGDASYALAPAALSPSGRAVPEGDGYVVSGRWSWGSGVMHADCVLVTAVVAGDVPDLRMVLADLEEVVVDDVWHTDGLRGTGSNDVVIDELFVPAERTVSFFDLVEGRAAVVNGHDEVALRLPVVPTLAFTAAAPLIGGAEGALVAFTDRLRERVLAYSVGERQQDKPAAQIRLAVAEADVRAAGLLLDDASRRLVDTYAAGATMTPAERSALRMAAAHGVHLSNQAVRQVADAAGGTAHFLDQPLQRFLRDVTVGSSHAVFDHDRAAETRGRILAGFEPRPTDMV
jgi:3-hydroxy-9,10-secoandrosta-1,3,5(10)-triene-9,17-dione monooxygenase